MFSVADICPQLPKDGPCAPGDEQIAAVHTLVSEAEKKVQSFQVCIVPIAKMAKSWKET